MIDETACTFEICMQNQLRTPLKIVKIWRFEMCIHYSTYPVNFRELLAEISQYANIPQHTLSSELNSELYKNV